jgi:hypothetical protein
MTITVMVPPDPRGGARGRVMRVMFLLLLPSDGMKIVMAVPVDVFIDFVSFEL